jgi:hypothetical protein
VIVSVHQPHYLPWTGYFDKIDTADAFVLLDTVQFEKNGWQNRNRIRTRDGWMWLTVPVVHRFGATIAETLIDARIPWARKHRAALAASYGKAPFSRGYSERLDGFYCGEWERLCPLAWEMLAFFLSALGIGTRVHRASDLGELPAEPNARLVSIVKRLGGDTYLAGSGCGDYFRKEPFEEAGIRVVFQDYKPAEYPQMHGEFIPGLAAIDLMVNCGKDSLEIIRKGRRTAL